MSISSASGLRAGVCVALFLVSAAACSAVGDSNPTTDVTPDTAGRSVPTYLEPTPVPTSADMVEGSFMVRTDQGYTYDVAFDVRSLSVAVDTQNSLPGQADVSIVVDGSWSVTNTTGGRNLPYTVLLDQPEPIIFGLYGSDYFLCGLKDADNRENPLGAQLKPGAGPATQATSTGLGCLARIEMDCFPTGLARDSTLCSGNPPSGLTVGGSVSGALTVHQVRSLVSPEAAADEFVAAGSPSQPDGWVAGPMTRNRWHASFYEDAGCLLSDGWIDIVPSWQSKGSKFDPVRCTFG